MWSANGDNVVHCETPDEACRVAEGRFPDNWDVRLDPTDSVDVTSAGLRQAFGPGSHHEPECPKILRTVP
jgi:hypothetical protein